MSRVAYHALPSWFDTHDIAQEFCEFFSVFFNHDHKAGAQDLSRMNGLCTLLILQFRHGTSRLTAVSARRSQSIFCHALFSHLSLLRPVVHFFYITFYCVSSSPLHPFASTT